MDSIQVIVPIKLSLKELKRKELNKKFICVIHQCQSRNTYYDKERKCIICFNCGFINFLDSRK